MAYKRKTQKQEAKQIEIAQRRVMVLKLRLQGGEYQQIADTLIAAGVVGDDYNKSTAFRDVKEELKRLNEECSETAEEIRRQEDERIRMLIQSSMELACPEDGMADVSAVNTVLRLSESRRKLWGVDTPVVVKQEVETTVRGVQFVIPEQFKSAEEWEKSQQ